MQVTPRRLAGRRRSEATAASIVVLSYLVITITLPDSVIDVPSRLIEIVALVVLVAVDATSRRIALVSEVVRTGAFIPAYVLLVLSVLYPLLQQSGREGELVRFLGGGILFTLSYGLVAVYCGLYYNSGRLRDAFWLWGRIALVVAFIGFAVSVVITDEFLVNYRLRTTFRLQGLMSEPSAWAPALAVLIIEASRRRSYSWLAATLAALLMTRSPTVMVVVGIAVPLFYLVTDRRGDRRATILLAAGVVVPLSIWFVGAVDPSQMLASNNPLVKTVGRLMAGIQGDAAGSEFATARLESTDYIWGEVWRSGNGLLGTGPGSSSVFFDFTVRSDLSGQTIAIRANNLWIETLFNFGLVGLAIIVVLTMIAVPRISRDADAAAVVLPFIVAALINSASGIQAYQFVAIAIFVFTFGIRPRTVRPDTATAQDRPMGSTEAVGRRVPEG